MQQYSFKSLIFCFTLAPAKQGMDNIYSEVRNSQQGMAVIARFSEILLSKSVNRKIVDIKEREKKNRKQDQPRLWTFHC